MVDQCLSSVCDAGPTLIQHWVNILCFHLGYNGCPSSLGQDLMPHVSDRSPAYQLMYGLPNIFLENIIMDLATMK